MAGRSHSARSGWFAALPFGAQQTLHPGRRKEMRETLVAAGIPFADVNVILFLRSNSSLVLFSFSGRLRLLHVSCSVA